MKKTISLVFLFAIVCTSMFAAKTVRVGWYSAPGLQDGSTDDAIKGYNYEYLKKIQSYTGWDYEFIYKPWKECEQMLIDGEIDIIGDVAITNERLNKYNFSDEPEGYSSMLLVTQSDNDEYYFGDFDSFDNITIASIHSTYRTSLVEEIAERYSFSYNVKYYDTHEELFLAVESGECDAAMFSNVNEYPSAGYKIIYKSRRNGFYFIVNKDSEWILSELNLAMQQISINDSAYSNTLFKKYFTSLEENSIIAYSKSDMEYLKTNPTINIFAWGSLPPYSFVDKQTDELKGIIPTYYNLLSKKTGIKFNFITKVSSSDIKNLDDSIKYEVLGMLVDDFAFSQKLDVNLTSPIFPMAIGFVRYVNSVSPIESVSIMKGVFLPTDFNEKYKIVECDNFEQLLGLVLEKKVDAAYMNVLTFNTFDKIPIYRNLYIEKETQLYASCAVLKQNVDPRLYSVMEKTIGNITEKELNEVIDRNTIYSIEPSLIQILVANKAVVILIIIIMLILFAIIIMQSRVNKLKVKNNKELQKALKKAKASDEAKSLFLLSMSHDLITPMNSIMGNSDIALNDLSDSKSVESSLSDIKASSQLLLNIINELLDLSEIEGDEIQLKEDPFNLRNLIVDIVKQTEFSAKQKNIKCKSSINLIHDNVIGDCDRFRHAVENIITNSIIYSEVGTIEISITENNLDENYSIYQLVITDTGKGMTDEQLERVFDRFYTASSSKSYKTGGIGIGLNIAKGILDKMNASVYIKSKLGKGTTFICDIPFPFLKQNDIVENSSKFILDLSDKRILIVEDIEINIKILMKMLASTAINIVVARNGQDALDKFVKDDNFDIIFMDLQMPVMDGYEATKRIRLIDSDKARNIPIIAVSANAFDTDVALASKVGMNEHFPKPVSMERMLAILKKYLVER